MPAPSRQRFEQLAIWFETAVRIPPGRERQAFVEEVSAGDLDVLTELERLLGSALQEHQGAPRAPARLPRFGAYQSRELLGAGGMGAVYLATREDGEVRQQVAVKAIASAFHSPILEERLRRERQILAELHHPNIAAFLGGGVTEDGFS